MWSRKRRKKEAKGGSGGPPPGKEVRSTSLPPSHSPRGGTRTTKPTPTARPQASTSRPSSPPAPPPPSSLTPPTAVIPLPHPPLANPNLKPGLTVPPPPAPINPSTILDSLKTSLLPETHSNPPPHPPPHPPQAPQDHTQVLSNSSVVVAGVGRGSAPVTVGTVSSSVAVAQQQSDRLQRVIEAQRTQLDLLSQITKSITSQHHHPHPLTAREPLSGVPGRAPPAQGPVSSRLQTFDYANRSSSELQSLAIQHLDKEYTVRGQWP